MCMNKHGGWNAYWAWWNLKIPSVFSWNILTLKIMGKWVSTAPCLTIILQMLLFTMSLFAFHIESGYNKLVYDCMPAWHLKCRWLFPSVSHQRICPIRGFLDLLARTLTISASARAQSWTQPVCCRGCSRLRFSIVFWIGKKTLRTECVCNAHWQTSRQRKSWMSCENGQVRRCRRHWGLWLSEQSPGAHRRLGCSQLNSVLLQAATACWNLAMARISSQHTHGWATMCVLFQRMGSAQSCSWETHQLHLRGWWDESLRNCADPAEPSSVFIAHGIQAVLLLLWKRLPCQKGDTPL